MNELSFSCYCMRARGQPQLFGGAVHGGLHLQHPLTNCTAHPALCMGLEGGGDPAGPWSPANLKQLY